MTYNKPEIVNLASSIKAIQGFDNKGQDVHTDLDTDSPVYPAQATINAYESDE